MLDGCTECVQYEMRAESVGLNHDNPSDFVRSQWPMNHKVYVIYRVAAALGMTAWFIADAFYETRTFFQDRTYEYAIYATNWSFFLLAFTTILKAVCTLYYSIRSGECLDRQTFERMPKALKLQWMLHNLCSNSAIVVTISYWTFIAVLDSTRVMQTHMSQMKHTLNTVYVLVDLFISAAPIRILHFVFTICLGSIYALFNAIYFLNDGTILEGRHFAYNLIDWGKPTEAIVTCVLCMVLCIFSQIVLYEVYRIRVNIFTKIYFGSDSEKPDSELQRIFNDPHEPPVYQTIDEREEDDYVSSPQPDSDPNNDTKQFK